VARTIIPLTLLVEDLLLDLNKPSPAGNAAIGDKVLLIKSSNREITELDYSDGGKGFSIRHGEVIELNLLSKQDWRSDIRVRWSDGEVAQITPFCQSPAFIRLVEPRVGVYLIPAEPLPAGLQEFLTLQELPVAVFRLVVNSETPRYGLYCGKCLGTLGKLIQTMSAMELEFDEELLFGSEEQIDGNELEALQCLSCNLIYKCPPDVPECG
jgi:hypothetical protein